MNIDWSKAPEDATYCLSGRDFFKLDGDGRVILFINGYTHNTLNHIGDFLSSSIVERPKKQDAWDGEGLPPAGLACEYRKTDAKYRQGFVAVKVLCYGKEKCFLQHEASKNEFTEDLSSVEFRPILTAEQVAAEEREKAIDEMVFGVCGCEPDGGNTSALMVCGFLYDAGYRKQ